MRLLVDSLIALMLAGILGGVLIHHRQEQWRVVTVQDVHAALSRLQEQMIYRGALGDVTVSETGHPLVILPEWFAADLPLNYAAPGSRPWIDLAPADDWSDQPPDAVIHSLEQAGFWYNPNRGIFRARIEPQVSDAQTLELYNQINGSALKKLPRPTPARRPSPQKILATGSAEAAAAGLINASDAGAGSEDDYRDHSWGDPGGDSGGLSDPPGSPRSRPTLMDLQSSP